MYYEYVITNEKRKNCYLSSYYPNDLPKITKNNNISFKNILNFNSCGFMAFGTEYEVKQYIQYMLNEAKENKQRYNECCPNSYELLKKKIENLKIEIIDY